MTQFIAALLYVAAGDIPTPEYWRHVRARLDLCRAMRRESVSAIPVTDARFAVSSQLAVEGNGSAPRRFVASVEAQTRAAADLDAFLRVENGDKN